MTRWGPALGRGGRAGRTAGVLTALAVVVGLGCSAGRALDPRTVRFPLPAFAPPVPEEVVLSGGAPAFLLEDPTVPLVRIYLAFRGGELYDPARRAGLSDVTALAWRTGGVDGLAPAQVDQALEERGMELSLSLGRERGWVTLSVLPADLARGLDLLARVVFEPTFLPERVAWAKTQVAEGILRQEDDPETVAFRELRRVLYAGHPRGVVATAETVARVEREDVLALWGRLIRESSWTVGATGQFRVGELAEELEGRFGRLPGAGDGFPVLPPPAPPEPGQVVVPTELSQSVVVWARLGPGRTDPDFYSLEVADYAVGSGGFRARLVREIRGQRGLAYSVGSFYQALPGFGVVGAFAQTKRESTGEVLGLLHGTLTRSGREGLDGDEVAEAREALVNRHVFRYADPATSVRDRMGLHLDGLPLDLPARYPEGVAGVSTAEAEAAVRSYFDPDTGVVVVVGAPAPSRHREPAAGGSAEKNPPVSSEAADQ